MPEGSFASLDFMFHPRSIAVAGASTQDGPGSFVAAIKEMGFKGDLYPVNPKAEEIPGLKCYPRLTDIPGARRPRHLARAAALRRGARWRSASPRT